MSTHQLSSKRRATRVGAGIAVAALAVPLLAGCGSSKSSTQSSSPKSSAGTTKTASSSTAAKAVTITFWNQYNQTDDEYKTMTDVVIPAFEKANPGIKVQSVYYDDNVIEQKFIAAAAAGDPPDVMRADIADVPALADQGTLTDLGSKMANFSQLTADALPGPLATNLWHGKYYGLPLDTNTQVLYYNKGIFKAAGLSGPPTTLDELYTDAVKLTDKSKQQYGLGVDGTDMWNLAPYIWSNGGQLINSAQTSTTGALDSPATEAVLDKLVSLYKAGDIGNDFAGSTGAISGEEGFPKGQYAMYIDGPWAVPTYAAVKNMPAYGMATFPTGAAGSISTVGGEDVVIPTGTKQLAAAEKFAAFLDGSFSQLQMAQQGDMSVMKSDAAGEVKNDPYDAIFATQLLTARDRPVVPNYQAMDTAFSNEMQKVLTGSGSVAGAMTAAVAQANSALAGSPTT